MRHARKSEHIGSVLRKIFTSPFYIALFVAATIIYYELFRYIIIISSKGVFFTPAPLPLVYALILSAAALLSISIYAVSRSIHAKYAGMEGSALSIITASLGDLVIGCTCYAPILSSALYALGFGALQVSDAISFLGDNQIGLTILFVAINLIFIYYQLRRISRIDGAGTHAKKGK